MASAWDAYIDQLKGHEEIAEAAIWGIEGTCSQWAASPGLALQAAEVQRMQAQKGELFGTGLVVAGKKYTLINHSLEDEYSYCMTLKSKPDGNNPSLSLVVGKTLKAFVIALGKENVTGPQIINRVFKTVEYLRKSGY